MSHATLPDELARLRDADPLPGSHGRGAAPEQLLAAIHRRLAEPAPGAQRRGAPLRRRTVAVALATVGLVGTATVGYAVLGRDDATSLVCAADGSTVVVNAVSPDPVADCVAALQGSGPPVDAGDLAVFSDGEGTVVVAPDADTAGRAVTVPLQPAPDLQVATDTIELRMALDDLVTGAASCSDPGIAPERATAILAELGLRAWKVVERDRPSGDVCSWSFADVATRRVEVVYDRSEPSTDDPAIVDVRDRSRRIHEHVDGSCTTAAEAAQIVRDAVAGMDHEPQITVNEDPDAACARVYTNAYGQFEITVFGP